MQIYINDVRYMPLAWNGREVVRQRIVEYMIRIDKAEEWKSFSMTEIINKALDRGIDVWINNTWAKIEKSDKEYLESKKILIMLSAISSDKIELLDNIITDLTKKQAENQKGERNENTNR